MFLCTLFLQEQPDGMQTKDFEKDMFGTVRIHLTGKNIQQERLYRMGECNEAQRIKGTYI